MNVKALSCKRMKPSGRKFGRNEIRYGLIDTITLIRGFPSNGPVFYEFLLL